MGDGNPIIKSKKLKVIIESGVLTDAKIKQATQLVCECGADFVKTSTGKVPERGATFEAVEAILEVLSAYRIKHRLCPGIKVSGGVNIHNVEQYHSLIEQYMGKEWALSNDHVRYGASALVQEVFDAIRSLSPAPAVMQVKGGGH